jgi:ribosomal-protein-alanine N-acetyltransferase
MDDFFLRSARLGFRCWRDADLPLALRLWGDADVTRFISDHGFTKDEIQSRLQLEIRTQRKHGIQYWPIFLLETGEHVGCCGFRPRENQTRNPELGVHVTSRHWRRGYAFEAASRAIAYAFVALGTYEIFAGHNPENVASRSLLAKLGFVHTHDEFYAPTGRLHPSYRLARPESVTAEPGIAVESLRSPPLVRE